MNLFRRIAFTFLVGRIAEGSYAQSVDDVGAKLNEGNDAMMAKQYAKAVAAYESAIKLAASAGSGADELKKNSEKQLVDAYYRNGISLYKAKKYDASVSELKKSLDMAKKVGDNDKIESVPVVMAKVLSAKGMSLIKDNNLDAAYSAFDEAHKVKPTCVISYYGKGIVWKEKGDLNKMMASMDKAIELGATEPKMDKYVDQAKNAASLALLAEANEEIKKEHGEEAAKYINESFKYKKGDADAYFNLTVAYNKSKSYTKAEEAANTALGLTQGDKSSVYFQLGQAREGQGNTSGACDAYQKVTSGPNVDAAKYQMTQVLGCG